jgi:hypothetical protein
VALTNNGAMGIISLNVCAAPHTSNTLSELGTQMQLDIPQGTRIEANLDAVFTTPNSGNWDVGICDVPSSSSPNATGAEPTVTVLIF